MTVEQARVSIVILVQHKVDLLLDCLRSIRTSSIDSSYEIIVVFNGTSASEIARVRAETNGIKCIRSRVNLGFSGGNNHAVRASQAEYIVFLNDDTIPEAGWLDALVSAADRTPRAGAVGSRILFPEGTLQEAGCIIWDDGTTYPMGRGEPAGSKNFSYPRFVDYCSANALLVRSKIFRDANGFDEGFFPAYYEDVDLCMTIRHRLGQRVLYEPSSRICHFEGASAEPTFRSFLFRRNGERIRYKWRAELRGYEPAAPSSPEAVDRACFRARESAARVLVIDDRIPNATLGSGFGRFDELVRDVSGSDFAVSFHPTATSEGDSSTLDRAGIELLSEDLYGHLQRTSRKYDVVIISRPHNYERFARTLEERQPEARLIYDAEALFHRRLFMQAEMESDPERRAQLNSDAKEMQTLEKRLGIVCDRVVCISLEEEALLKNIEGHCPIELLVPLASGVEVGKASFEEREGMIFAAGWLAGDPSPNVAALQWFVESVMPLILSELPCAVLRVSGNKPPQSVRRLASPNVRFLGFVEDMEGYYNAARVAVSPITYGAGVKIKTIEAIQRGVPLVATQVGAEGLGLVDNHAIDISDHPAVFAQRVVELLRDHQRWENRRREMSSFLQSLEKRRVSWNDIIKRTLARCPASF